MKTIDNHELEHIVGGAGKPISPIQSRRNIILEVQDPSCCWGGPLKQEFDDAVKLGHVSRGAWTTPRNWMEGQSLKERYDEIRAARQ